MIKIVYLSFVFVFISLIVFSQVETKYFPNNDATEHVKLLKDFFDSGKIIEMPSFDLQKYIDEDKQIKETNKPFRFGKGFEANISFSDGEWSYFDGGRFWTLKIRSKGAFSLNFIFKDFFLPEGAQLFIVNSTGSVLYGPVTPNHIPKNGTFLTDLIQGDKTTILLYETDSCIGKSKIMISKIVHAYKNIFPEMSYGNLGGSESCNNNINCFSAYDIESDGVALVLLSNGTEFCSGSLLMTADQSFRPYLLTAFHCIDTYSNGELSEAEISNAEDWLFKFQYKMATCTGSIATTGITYNGAQFRAAWNNTDFALLEMNNSPIGDIRFSWLGWDRGSTAPSSGFGIHHPSGDVMKISFEEDEFQTSNWDGTNNHWLVSFDDGVVEHCSSGSSIFNQNNRVVGQLHGNQNYDNEISYCEQERAEYGRFNLSWTGGGTNTTRLSNWLDHCVSSVSTTNTSRTPYLSGPSIVCSTGAQYSVIDQPYGTTLVWSQSNNLTRVSAQGDNPCTFSSNDNGAGWIDVQFITSCDTTVLPRKTIWAGDPGFTPVVTGSDYIACDTELFTEENNRTVTWSVDGPLQIVGSNIGYRCFVEATGTGYGWVYGTVSNDCGSYRGELLVEADCGYLLKFTPNPSNYETTISIEASQASKSFDQNSKWDLEIFSEKQILIKRHVNISGKELRIFTGGWNNGIYLVRVSLNGITLSGKFIVNKY